MTEATQDIFTDARKGKHSTINNELSQDDVSNVWENVSEFIERQMQHQKAVNLNGLGTFTFMQNTLDVGNNKFVLIQRPVFQISEKFTQTHGLQVTKYHVPGTIPVVPLNYAAVSVEGPFNRETIESCVKEVLASVGRAVAAKKNVELMFMGIGRLMIRESKVKMRFLKEFINQLDGSGKMLDSMSHRPGTVDSVMSNESTMGRHSVNTILLPVKQHHFSSGAVLTPVPETYADNSHEHEDDTTLLQTSHNPTNHGRIESAQSAVGDEATDDAIRNIMRGDHWDDLPESVRETYREKCYGGGDDGSVPAMERLDEASQDTGDTTHKPRPLLRHTIPIAQASGFGIDDDVLLTRNKVFSRESRLSKSSPAPLHPLLDLPPMQQKTRTPPHLAPLRTPRPPTTDKNYSNRAIPAKNLYTRVDAMVTPLDAIKSEEGRKTQPETLCGHPIAGQELCYLCHQRARRNVPVSFAAERKKQQEDDDQAIEQYRMLRDAESNLKEEEIQLAKRHEQEKMAAFNQGVFEAKQIQPPPDNYKSYVFEKRPLTPHKIHKQMEYGVGILKQCEVRDKKRKTLDGDTRFLERLEQSQLADDLARERQELVKDKFDNQMMYKRALDVQPEGGDVGLYVGDILSPRNGGIIDQVMHTLAPIPKKPKIQKLFDDSSDITILGNQVKLKPVPLPARREDNEFFGKNDSNKTKVMDKRRMAQNLLQDQQQLVEQRKRAAILNCLTNQKDERNVIVETKRQMMDDGVHRHAARVMTRKLCEKDWESAAELKRARELEDKLRDLEPFIPLHDQCRKYERCDQCQRRCKNTGKWNIWCESRYIPGTRLMV